jgi:Tol biopolymer transport system component
VAFFYRSKFLQNRGSSPVCRPSPEPSGESGVDNGYVALCTWPMAFQIIRSTLIGLLLAVGIAVVAIAEAGDLKHPDWHPDGRHLVAEGSCAGSIDVYLIDVQTGSVRLVWDGGFTEGYPRWFSDGKRIAFHQIDDQRESRLFLAELSLSGDFSDVRRISSGPFDIEPAPSPDGSQLVYSQQGEKGLDIALFDLGSGVVSRVWKTDAAENFPSWHPDGESITFYARNASGTQIYSLDLESDQINSLTSGAGPNFVGDLSPDGTMLAYSSERTGDREIYLRGLASGEDQQVTDRVGRDGYVKFSPDGRQLAYHSGIESGSDSYVVIKLLDLDTGELSAFSCRTWFGVL